MRHPQRYTAVPWLSASDLAPMGRPEKSIELLGGLDLTVGLRIVQPFGRGSDVMLAVHAAKVTGVITLAIHEALPTVDLEINPAQSSRNIGVDDAS